MGKEYLKKEDLWCSILGGAALATGGGGSALSYEAFSEIVDPVYESGYKPTLIDAKDISDDAPVLVPIGIGGGISRKYREMYGPPVRRGQDIEIAFKEMHRLFPLLHDNARPKPDWRDAGAERLRKLKGEDNYVAYLAGEIGPGIFRQAINGVKEGIPVIDADMAGQRAVPELSFTSFNVYGVKVTPIVISTLWGDRLVYEEALSWQRLEDITRSIALVSQGFNSTMLSVTGKDVKEAGVLGSYSKAIEVGKAIHNARESGDDPIEKIVEAANGYKIFEGEIVAKTNEGDFAFVWGNGWIKGSGKYQGKLLRFWFKNENQVSWLDGKPYVRCPDPFTVIDSETGEGLSNFRESMWTQGRKVAVVGVKAVDCWRTERGIQIYNPKHFGFDLDYVPIEELIE
ncbi:MAG: DUF917 domain-containing protein [Candidatus Thorarchaeota archaeon]|jgi:DUF917 family protein